ncbi:hypothetical protein [Streptomyces cadmiisoli]|uniref:Uncharacterized protein n=1 Tax=Streptomyces cadmiisoli TaxID=2184053 RepID=A0A2Z4JDI0_9ACTN|nr:hypothetical protein [Streptomyces cadmiisoli]AWW43212.1 hypothetical protein DN051_42185 [Streptomyces cadmiisoli]
MKIAHFTRSRIAPIAAILGAGALLGTVGPFASKFDNLACQAVGVIFSVGWSWACFAFLVGYSRRSRIEASLLASSALAVGVAVYYIFKFLSPDVPAGGHVISGAGDGLSSRALFWGVAAFVFGAPIGLLGSMARTPGIGGLGFRLLVPLIAFFEASLRLTAEVDDSQGRVVEMVWASVRALSAVAVVLLVGHTVWNWWHGRGTRQPAPAKRL